MENNTNTQATEAAVDPVLENAKVEVCPECGKPIDECVCSKAQEKPVENACGEKQKEYSLEEIPEYVELKNQYEALQTNYSTLEAEKAQLLEKNNELMSFKAKIEKAEKEDMINKFSMLSDEDKKDVVEHVDEYSLDEIEAKLAVICVRNKVNFEQLENNKSEPIVYNLNTEPQAQVDDGPAWLSAVYSASKNK